MAPYQSLPDPVILQISANLDAKDFCSLLLTDKRTAEILKPFLAGLACQPQFAQAALKVYGEAGNHDMFRLLLDHGEMDCVTRYEFFIRFERNKRNFYRRGGAPAPPVLRRIPPTLAEWKSKLDLMHLQLPEEFCSNEVMGDKGWVLRMLRKLKVSQSAFRLD